MAEVVTWNNEMTIKNNADIVIANIEFFYNNFLEMPNRFVTVSRVYKDLGIKHNINMYKYMAENIISKPVYVSMLNDFLNISGWYSDCNGKRSFIKMNDLSLTLEDVLNFAKKLSEAEWLE